MNKQELIEKVKLILDGIDKDECEYNDGWWPTSHGAKFGAAKLNEIVEAIQSLTEPAEVSKIAEDELLNLANKSNGYNLFAKETKAPIYNEGFVNGFKLAQNYATQSNTEAMRVHAIDEQQIIEEIIQEEITKDAFADFTIDSIKQAMMKYGKYLQQYNIR